MKDMKKIYMQPAARMIDLFEEEGIMAMSDGDSFELSDETVDTQMTEKKESFWGNANIWN